MLLRRGLLISCCRVIWVCASFFFSDLSSFRWFKIVMGYEANSNIYEYSLKRYDTSWIMQMFFVSDIIPFRHYHPCHTLYYTSVNSIPIQCNWLQSISSLALDEVAKHYRERPSRRHLNIHHSEAARRARRKRTPYLLWRVGSSYIMSTNNPTRQASKELARNCGILHIVHEGCDVALENTIP